MAKRGGVADYNSFVQGLITEASPLTYPANASLDEANFELQRNGARYRRLGIGYEFLYSDASHFLNYYNDTIVQEQIYMSFEWKSAGNRGGHDFAVVQQGKYIYFYAMEGSAISQNKLDFLVYLPYYQAPEATDAMLRMSPISVANVKGYLIVTSAAIDPILIKYDPDQRSFTLSTITVEVRDFTGLEDEFEIDYRPPTAEMNTEHYYNLYNQGWLTANLTTYNTAKSAYPSNADIQHLGKDSTGAFTAAQLDKQYFGNTPAPKGKFIYNILHKKYANLSFTNTLPANTISYSNGLITVDFGIAHSMVVGDEFKLKGVKQTATWEEEDWESGSVGTRSIVIKHEKDNLNNKYYKVNSVTTNTITFRWKWDGDIPTGWGGSRVSNKTLVLSGGRVHYNLSTDVLEEEIEERRFETVAGYAGRAWYSGIDGGQYSSYVFYSKTLERAEFVGECFQEADPTSEHQSDLVDTDGGYIVIPEMDRCVTLVPMGSDLFVFGNNGVWKISGIDGTFTATAYRVDKVSSVGAWGPFSVVAAENQIFYWAKGGIYTVAANEVSQAFASSNISEVTIQSLFNDIPSENKKYVKGHYDPTTKTVEWLINTDLDYAELLANKEVTPTNYNMILRFDLVLQAWYKYELPLGGPASNGLRPFIAGVFNTQDVTAISTEDNVRKSNGDLVVDSLGNDVIAVSRTTRDSFVQSKYLAIGQQRTNPSLAGYWFMTFANFNDSAYVDWRDDDGNGYDFSSYLVTGFDLMGSQATKKQSHYLLMFFDQTEQELDAGDPDNPSSCLVRSQWDWANSANSGKWGTQFQAYRLPRHWYAETAIDSFDYGQGVVVTKSKLRGRGRSLSIHIESERGKDMKLLGWSIVASGGMRP